MTFCSPCCHYLATEDLRLDKLPYLNMKRLLLPITIEREGNSQPSETPVAFTFTIYLLEDVFLDLKAKGKPHSVPPHDVVNEARLCLPQGNGS